MVKCQAITLAGNRCSRNAMRDSNWCGFHKKKLPSKKSVRSVKENRKINRSPQSYESMKVFLASDPKSHKFANISEKMRMANECGTKCCATIVDGICKYPSCKVGTCKPDCGRLRKSRIAAGIRQSPKKVKDSLKHAFQRSCSVISR